MSLRHMCKRLEVLAHKQLRGVSFSKKDNYFLTDFGEKLAAVIPYYEFVSPIGLTDEQWKKRFDGDEPPESPVWLKPIMAP